MSDPFEHRDSPPDERVIRSLSDRSGVDVGKVRALFQHELSRLRMGAKVGSYLTVLTTANVRGMLRRRARRTEAARAAQDGEPSAEQCAPGAGARDRGALPDAPSVAWNLHRWEDDGGGEEERGSEHERR